MSHINKILVPLDGSAASIAALAQAVTLAEDVEASVEVLHVIAPDEFEVGSATAMSPGAREQAESAMEVAYEEAQRLLKDRLNRRDVAGEPVRTILEIAANEGVDLIVVGTQGRVGRMHALFGSVAEGLVRNAPCPVLTVRHSDGGEESFAERIHGREALAEQARPPR